MFNFAPQTIQASTISDVPVKVDIAQGAQHISTLLPAAIKVRPSTFKPLTISVVDECFVAQQYRVEKTLNLLYVANLLNVHGLYLDFLTGYMWNYEKSVRVPAGEPLLNNDKCTDEMLLTRKAPGQLALVDLTKASQGYRNSLGMHSGFPLRSGRKGPSVPSDSGSLFGFFYGFRFEPTIELQASWTMNNGSDYYGSYLDNASIYYSGSLLALSVRYFPRGAGLYAGVGMGQYFVDMSYSSYTGVVNDDVDARLNYSLAFVELGWQKDIAPFVLSINTRVDLAALGFGRAPPNEFGDDLGDIITGSHREWAMGHFSDLLDVSGLSVGVAFAF